MAWLQLRLDLEADELETVQESCEKLGALSVSLVDAAADAGGHPILEPLPGEMPVWPTTRIVALFESKDAAHETRQALRLKLADQLRIEVPETAISELPERDWANVWRKDAQAVCFGGCLWICQDGQRPDDKDGLIVDLDPGLAFGTGGHPSTALCLEWLTRSPLKDRTLVDYGCGSGILAVAAARLGAASVIATDIDEQALIATRENAARNGLADRIRVTSPDSLKPRETDILVANILANPLRQLAPRFAELLRADGLIALAGLLQEQVALVQRDFNASFLMAQSGRNGDWALLAGRRRATGVSGGA